MYKRQECRQDEKEQYRNDRCGGVRNEKLNATNSRKHHRTRRQTTSLPTIEQQRADDGGENDIDRRVLVAKEIKRFTTAEVEPIGKGQNRYGIAKMCIRDRAYSSESRS